MYRNAILSLLFTVDGKEAPVREVSRTRGTSGREQQQVTAAMLDVSGSGVNIYGSRQQQAPAVGQSLQNVDTGRDGKRGVLSQLIEKVLRLNMYRDVLLYVPACIYFGTRLLDKMQIVRIQCIPFYHNIANELKGTEMKTKCICIGHMNKFIIRVNWVFKNSASGRKR
jgi:hypothetical protein